jgi:hypothetical protein
MPTRVMRDSKLKDIENGSLLHRDGMTKTDWLRLVAVHSDAWLLSLAMGYFASQLDRATRYTATVCAMPVDLTQLNFLCERPVHLY